MVLQRRKAIPMLRLFHVLFDPDSLFVKPCQIALSISVTMLCCAPSPIQCFRQVFFNAETTIIEVANLAFSKGISSLRQDQMAFEAFIILF